LPKDQDLIKALTFLAEVAYDRATQTVTESQQSTKSSLEQLFVK
jgi:hypothetical protein